MRINKLLIPSIVAIMAAIGFTGAYAAAERTPTAGIMKVAKADKEVWRNFKSRSSSRDSSGTEQHSADTDSMSGDHDSGHDGADGHDDGMGDDGDGGQGDNDH